MRGSSPRMGFYWVGERVEFGAVIMKAVLIVKLFQMEFQP
jgi:hypothetical protein